jgi:tRNA G46 methylase TrmB
MQVSSPQTAIHENLESVVRRHLAHPFLKVPAAHTVVAFEAADEWVRGRGAPVVLDSGCGTGESSVHLAHKFPNASIVALDQSEVRLEKASKRQIPENLRFFRADHWDFYPLLKDKNWQIIFHALYYPNPWPKPAHLMRRLHGHPLFTLLLGLAPLEMRCNWKVYADEFAFAASLAWGRPVSVERLEVAEPITAFERKYWTEKQDLWKVEICELVNSRV